MSENTPDFLSNERLELLIFGGKGGVGKTTAASASALHIAAARPGKRVLLLSTDPAHSVGDCLDGLAVPVNLCVVELSAESEHKAFMEAHSEHLKTIASRGTFLDAQDIDRFVQLSIPGLDELMAFLRVARWVEDDAFDVIVVDTAPSGHTLKLLSMSDLLGNWLEALDALLAKHKYMIGLFGRSKPKATDLTDEFLESMRTQIDALSELIADKDRCRFVPVMLAEPMSVAETSDVLARLNEMGVAAPEVIINRLVDDRAGQGFAAQRALQDRVLTDGIKVLGDRRVFGAMLMPEEVTGAGRLAAFANHLELVSTSQLMLTKLPDSQSLAQIPSCDGVGRLPASGKSTKLLFFAGKGGVGKTTLAAMSAVRLASQGRRCLLVSTDPAHSLGDCLGATLSDKPSELMPGLDVIEIDAASEFEALRDQYRDELAVVLDKMFESVDLSFDREAMDKLMDLAPPGLDECMALLRIIDNLDKPTADGKPAYDAIVIDTAPTGHLLRLLELPELISSWLSSIFSLFLKYDNIFRLPRLQSRLVWISRGIKQLRGVIVDPKRCEVQVVSILTEMALAECGDLVSALDRMNVRVANLFLNLALPLDESPLGVAVRRREACVLGKYASRFPKVNQAVIERAGDPRGLERLLALSQRVYGDVPQPRKAA